MMNPVPPTKTRHNRWQFGLRSLLLVVTLAAVASAWFGWRCRNYELLCAYVEGFNAAMDAQEYAKAGEFAARAKQLAPREPVVDHMLAKVGFVQALMRGEQQLGGMECFGDEGPLESGFSAKRWEALTELRRKMTGNRGANP